MTFLCFNARWGVRACSLAGHCWPSILDYAPKRTRYLINFNNVLHTFNGHLARIFICQQSPTSAAPAWYKYPFFPSVSLFGPGEVPTLTKSKEFQTLVQRFGTFPNAEQDPHHTLTPWTLGSARIKIKTWSWLEASQFCTHQTHQTHPLSSTHPRWTIVSFTAPYGKSTATWMYFWMRLDTTAEYLPLPMHELDRRLHKIFALF